MVSYTKEFVIAFVIVIWLCLSSLFYAMGYHRANDNNTKIVHVNFEQNETTLPENWKYSFMSNSYSAYIENLANELGIDSDLVVSILLVENPSLNPDAEHRNENGTIDCGMFQLNSKYIYTDFIPDYWDLDVEFNPFNQKHNTFMAMHHIQHLSKVLKVQDDVIAAYNAGTTAVMSGNIPASTINYVKAVNNNYKMLKGNEG